MAGAGYKAWSAGDVLTASDVNTYLMQQSVMTFAGTAARASAVAAPSEGMQSYRTDENVLETYDGSQWVPSTAMTPTSLMNRNMIINGAMQVAQRGTATTNITGYGYFTVDRFNIVNATLGTWTQTVEADAPTGSGFRKSVKMTCGTADASPAAGDALLLQQPIEGQNSQNIKKGTASAEKVTLSFWVKSNVTGTYIAQLEDTTNNRAISAAYTISSSGTWERKVITFAADTTGVLPNDSSGGLSVQWWLAAGSNFTSGTLQTAWGSQVTANRAVGQVNVAASANNYWQLTGVQFEVGNTATPFEFEPYETTLRKCQRYYYRIAPGSAYGQLTEYGTAVSVAQTYPVLDMPVTMRATPTSLESSNNQVTDLITSYTISTLAIYAAGSGPDRVMLECTGISNPFTQYRSYNIRNGNNTAGYLAVSAEL